MVQVFSVAVLLLSVALANGAVDDNWNVQNFGDCGHHLTEAECQIWADADQGSAVTLDTTSVSDNSLPVGCSAKPDPTGSIPTEYYYMPLTMTTTMDCEGAATDGINCICDSLNGYFADGSQSVACTDTTFSPTFVYNADSEAQSYTIDYVIGTPAGDTDCEYTATGTTTDATLSSSGSDFTGRGALSYGTEASPKCGGAFSHSTDESTAEVVNYKVGVVATVTRKFRSDKVERKRKFVFELNCNVLQEFNEATGQNFKVSGTVVQETKDLSKENHFTFVAELEFYDGMTDSATKNTGTAISPDSNEKVYAQVEQTTDGTLFGFSTQKCWATAGAAADGGSDASKVDEFFTSQCNVDETMNFAYSSNNLRFMFEIMAFTLSGHESEDIYFHCELKVCLKSKIDPASSNVESCKQKAQADCNAESNNRKRRALEYQDPNIRDTTVTSKHSLLLKGAEFNPPHCGNGFVYDRVAKECSQTNVMEITGIHLSGDEFKADYYNTSSKAFRDMSRQKEYQLWVLIMVNQANKMIKGIEVVRARPGSVILDVAVKYDGSVAPQTVFETFKQIIETPATKSRVSSVLQIQQEKTIEFIPYPYKTEKSSPADTEKLILIVVVVVLFVVVFIAGATLFKVKQMRQQPPQPVVGIQNKGIDA